MAWDDIPEWAKDIAQSILLSVKAKDEFTFYHCCRVGRASRRLGKAMGLNEFDQSVLEFSGLFHDIGKVGVPDNILLKPGRLTGEEITVMKSHPELSAQIIEPLTHIPFFKFLMPGIRYHHEKFDGSGYPIGLAGEKIPLPARVIAVVDTVDAMANARPYRQALPMDKILRELQDYSGTQFDGNIVKIYLEARVQWEKEKEEEVQKNEIVVAKIIKAA